MATRRQVKESLTAEETVRLQEFHARYFAQGSCTDPADRPRFEAAMAQAYRLIGKSPPAVVWAGSPLSASILIALLQQPSKTRSGPLSDSLGASLHDSLRSLRDSLRDSLGASLHASLHDSLSASLGASLGDSLRASLGDSLSASLHDSLRSLGDSLRASLHDSLFTILGDSLHDSLYHSLRYHSLRASLRASLHDSLRASLRDSLFTSLGATPIVPQDTYWWGQQDSYWIAFYQFCSTLPGVTYAADAQERLTLMDAIAASAMWWYPYEQTVVACERPALLQWEAPQGDRPRRLHSAHGPSVRCRDGWSLYHLHGVHFDEALYRRVISRTMPMAEVMQIADIDQRTQAMRFAATGIREFYRAEGGVVLDTHDKWLPNGRPLHYELWQLQQGKTFTKPVRFCLYPCPSALKRGEIKEYAKGVPDMATVAEAMAWGMSDATHTVSPEDWKAMTPLLTES